ncbi:MAG: TetR/AcrR family transcriptional regulator [Pseudomonadota bacterium]
MNKPNSTRARIMETARCAVLQKGFDATSIEEIVASVGITKSGFFYHFPDKNALARAMLEDYIEEENELFDRLFDRAAQLTDDPLQRVLIGLQFFAEAFDEMETGHPGCLIAAAAYQDRLFDAPVRNLYRAAMLGWRARFRGYLDEVVAEYAPHLEVDLDDVADLFCTTAEGGIVMARAIGERRIAPAQIRLLRNHIRLLFSPVHGKTASATRRTESRAVDELAG